MFQLIRTPKRVSRFTILFLAASLVCASLTLAAMFAPKVRPLPWTTPTERYDRSFHSIQTVHKLYARVEALGAGKSIHDKVFILERLLRDRFYAGYARYSFHDNWIAWLSAKAINPDYDAIVAPNDILANDWAACSQQAIVVQAVLQKMGVPFASVGVEHHFFSVASLGGEWFIVDPFGPIARDRTRLHKLEEVMTREGRDRYFITPESKAFGQSFAWKVPEVKSINQFPAPRALLFHQLTAWASDWLWLVLLACAFASQAIRQRWQFVVRIEDRRLAAAAT